MTDDENGLQRLLGRLLRVKADLFRQDPRVFQDDASEMEVRACVAKPVLR
jgi:hypothetical protein